MVEVCGDKIGGRFAESAKNTYVKKSFHLMSDI